MLRALRGGGVGSRPENVWLSTCRGQFVNMMIEFLWLLLLPGGRGVWRRGLVKELGRGRGRSFVQPWCGSLKRLGVKN